MECMFVPQKILYNSVFAVLKEQLESNGSENMVLVVPSLVAIVEHATDEDYKNIVQAELKRVITMPRPVQVRTCA